MRALVGAGSSATAAQLEPLHRGVNKTGSGLRHSIGKAGLSRRKKLDLETCQMQMPSPDVLMVR